MASASISRTLCRSIQLGSVSSSRFKRFSRPLSGSAPPYDVVLPHRTCPQVDPDVIPRGVQLPSYARSGKPDYSKRPVGAECHSEETVGRIRAACALAKALLTEVGTIIKPGMTTGA